MSEEKNNIKYENIDYDEIMENEGYELIFKFGNIIEEHGSSAKEFKEVLCSLASVCAYMIFRMTKDHKYWHVNAKNFYKLIDDILNKARKAEAKEKKEDRT